MSGTHDTASATPRTSPEAGRSTDATPMVQVEGLHKMFGDLHVLKGVDLEVARGSVCVVLGLSG